MDYYVLSLVIKSTDLMLNKELKCGIPTEDLPLHKLYTEQNVVVHVCDPYHLVLIWQSSHLHASVSVTTSCS